MKPIRWWRVLGLSLLLLVLAGAGAVWLLLARYAQPFAQREIRKALTGESELALAPFEVDFSIFRDFPYPTATLRHLALTDTTHGRAVPVLQIGELDLRLVARELLHRRVRVTRLTVRDILVHQEVDSLGRSWGLRGKKRPTPQGHAPALEVAVDSVLLYNLRITTHNDYIHSALAASARYARLALAVHAGQMSVRGHFAGSLDELRNRSGTLLAHEPVQGRVHYRYEFERRRGTFLGGTRATLNGDTITLVGTHRADSVHTGGAPRGTWLNLRFSGNQPLVEVLDAALPPVVKQYMAGAVSPSKARLVYTMSGLSGPRVRPRIIMNFGLRGASIQWPDSARRIDRWDLQATYDNGPAHDPSTMRVRFNQCRVYSPVGQLDVSFLLRDFRRPYVEGHLHGRTDLPALAVVLPSSRWHASQGVADLNVRLRGLLPMMGPRHPGEFRKNMSVFGTATLHDVTLRLKNRRTGLQHLNVQIGLRDSLWQLTNASGVLGQGMRFKASASTVHLLDFFTDQSETARIAGTFDLNELDLGQLRELIRRPGSVLAPSPTARTTAQKRRLAATLGRRLIPPGLRLDVALHLGKLALATDTLRDLAVRVRHDGRLVQLTGIRGRLWDGAVSGRVQWPTDSTNAVAPVSYNVAFKFDTLSYKYLLSRLSHPPKHSAKRPTSPAVRELLLAANGHLSYDINTLALPDGEALRAVHLRLDKDGSALNMPEMRFTAPQGGRGRGQALVLLDGLHIVAADATLDLRYAQLDIPRLLQLMASVAPPQPADSAARAALRAARLARRLARNGGQRPTSMLTNGQFTALLRVEADQVRYGGVTGGSFRLVSRLREGEALLDVCTLNTQEGRISLRGKLITNAGSQHHPLQVQALLEDINLPTLFQTFTDVNLNVLTANNIRGSLRCAAALRTDLDARFLPNLNYTTGYLKADIRNLELIDVEALEDAFKLVKKRTHHLYFEPVATEFVLSKGQLLIPDLRLDSNLTELQVSGRYGFDGRANLFIGMNPVHALLGNNQKRIARIQAGEEVNRHATKLTYVNLSRTQPHTKYQVRVFQKNEQRQQQAILRRQSHLLILTQRLDTTLHLLPRTPLTASPAQPATSTADTP
ncbi:AsmA-like C-terminal region-containing protein [Hymenobacter sp. RP-2-7]|uniref:AsmA-like C-terminal region-containing protein n=1 Tax=Hymenobacter polaris TaxID=2682546 RepID=A0A7Y0AAP5_9BACT|nr:AsmA-like C-terminal region-containing protein [Hymenobacter polaris]NML63843.1 AsmA-like C-terminal region-containing protein [Hymenobacter polaris]